MGPVYRDPLAHASLYTPSGTRRNECLTRDSAGRLAVHPPLGGATTKAVLIGVQDVGAVVCNRGIAGEVIDSGRGRAGRGVAGEVIDSGRGRAGRGVAGEVIDSGRGGAGRVVVAEPSGGRSAGVVVGRWRGHRVRRLVVADAHTRSRWNVVIAHPRARASELIDVG